jgi:hypothetical protein
VASRLQWVAAMSNSVTLPPSLTVRVVPRDRHWQVCAPGRPLRMIDSLCTKERAVEHAFAVADELMQTAGLRRVVIVVERRDGSIDAQHAA